MDEQVIKHLIQEAWNEGDSNPKDRFGDFLNRAAHKICELFQHEIDAIHVALNRLANDRVKAALESQSEPSGEKLCPLCQGTGKRLVIPVRLMGAT